MPIRTHCRCCSAACGILVELEGERVHRVRGDVDDPRSRGYLCPKGASLPAFHHHPERLLQPRLHGRDSDWSHCLDDLAGILKDLDPDSIACYQGTGGVSDSLGVASLAGFMQALGSAQFYCAATVDVAPTLRASEMVTGSWELNPVWVPEHPDSRLVLYLGSNPAVSHGYLTLLPDPVRRLQQFRRGGGRVWVVDPRHTRSTALADGHLPIAPGTDAELLAWLVRELLRDGADRTDYEAMTTAGDRTALEDLLAPFDRNRCARATGLSPAALEALLTDIRAAGRLAVVIGTGITFGADALLTEWLRWVLLIVTGSLDRPGGMWFNPGWLSQLEQRRDWHHSPPAGKLEPGPRSRPELPRLLDQQPCAALVDEIEAGHLRALIVTGGNPLTAFPQPERTRRALRRLDALVVLDVLDSPLAGLATHALPAAEQLERADIIVETATLYAPAVRSPQGSARPAWWSLAQLARRLDLELDLLKGLDPDHTTDQDLLRRLAGQGRDSADALFTAGPAGVTPPPLYGWVRERALPQGRWRLLPPAMPERLAALAQRHPNQDDNGETPGLTLISARQLTRTNSTGYMPPAKSPDLPRLRLHPDDAAARDITQGDPVRVSSSYGTLTATAVIDLALRPGLVSLPHGWHEVNVCRLTSSTDLDPLTTQPYMTALQVRVESLATETTAEVAEAAEATKAAKKKVQPSAAGAPGNPG